MRKMLAASTFLALACSMAGTADPLPFVSFAELAANEAAYEGKPIRLHGMILKCGRLYCGLCPDWNGEASTGSPSRCLDILSWQDFQAFKQLDELATLTEVTISGTYERYKPHPIVFDMEVDWICARNCSERGKIVGARIEDLKRVPATHLSEDLRGHLLRAPTASEDADIRASLEKATTTPDVSWDKNDTRIYMADKYPWAYACHWDFTGVPEADRRWPSREGDLGDWYRSLADPYTCWEVSRADGWKIHPRPVHEE